MGKRKQTQTQTPSRTPKQKARAAVARTPSSHLALPAAHTPNQKHVQERGCSSLHLGTFLRDSNADLETKQHLLSCWHFPAAKCLSPRLAESLSARANRSNSPHFHFFSIGILGQLISTDQAQWLSWEAGTALKLRTGFLGLGNRSSAEENRFLT